MATDYTRDEIDVVIDLIRRDNSNKALSNVMVTFGNPNVFTPTEEINRNTMVVGTARPGFMYRNSQSFYYNRVPLTKFVEPGVTNLDFDPDGKLKISDILPELNERLNINLEADRIIDSGLPVLGDQEVSVDVQIQVLPTSMVYLGNLLVKLKRADNDLVVAIPDPILDGLVYAAPPMDD